MSTAGVKIQGTWSHDRADIIVGGLLPLIVLMDKIDAKKVLFSESGVREGIITEYIQKEYGTK